MPNVQRFWRERPELVFAVLALCGALAFSQIAYPFLSRSLRLQTDADKFGEVGWNLASAHRFAVNGASSPSLDKGPAYPALLACVYTVAGGRNDRAVQIIQALLHALTVILVFRIALALQGSGAARIAAFIAAVHPMLLWYTARIWTETLLAFLVTLAAYVLVRLMERGSVRTAAGLGIAAGLSILTKSTLWFFLPLLCVTFLFRGNVRRAKLAAIAALVSLVCVAPWTARNYAVSGKFVPVQVSLGFNMIQGDVVGRELIHYPFSTMQLWEIGKVEVDTILAGSGVNEWSVEGDRMLVRASLRKQVAHPAQYFARIAANAFTFWYLSESEAKSLFLFVLQAPLAIAFFMSLRKWRNMPAKAKGIAALILYFVLLHALVVGWARYSAPMVPIAVALTAAAYASAPGMKRV